jgi:hypothetical protein
MYWIRKFAVVGIKGGIQGLMLAQEHIKCFNP